MIRILLNKFTAFIGLILFLLVGNNGWGQYTGTVTISSTGNATYTVPAGVTCLTVQIWGACAPATINRIFNLAPALDAVLA